MNIGFAVTLCVFIFVILFLSIFEKKHPKAKELVLIADLVVLSICARGIFSFVPYFNPVIGLLIIWAVNKGALTGFIIGALTAFGSNFIFGQGPWTVFQCFSWGGTAFIFGLLSRLGVLNGNLWSKKDFIFAGILSFLVVLIFTGPFCDLSSFFLAGIIEKNALKIVLLAGVPFNATLGLSTVLTLFLCANPLFKILKRV